MSNFGAYGDLNSLFTKLKQRLSLRPKTFTGTQDEWDALTVADRQEYEIVNITDDYTPSAGGGHKIEDSEGTELTQRDTLQVGGSLIAEDDPVNEKTIITNGRQTIDYEDWIELTPQEQAAIPEAVIINAPDGGYGQFGNVRYSEETDFLQVLFNGEWYDTYFVGMNSFYIFKPNNGAQFTWVEGTYTDVENTNTYFRMYPNLGSQFQWILFNEDLSQYLGMNKKIRIKYKTTYDTADQSLGVMANTSPSAGSTNRRVYNLDPSLTVREVEFPLDDLLTATYKYIGLCCGAIGGANSVYVYDLSIKS